MLAIHGYADSKSPSQGQLQEKERNATTDMLIFLPNIFLEEKYKIMAIYQHSNLLLY